MRVPITGRVMICCVLAVVIGPQIGVSAQSKEEIRESMKQRYLALQRLREQGEVGETYRGYVEAVSAQAAQDEGIRRLVREENADRQNLYQAIAMDVGTTAEAVGRINAQRIFDDARAEVFFKPKGGEWKRKREIETLE